MCTSNIAQTICVFIGNKIWQEKSHARKRYKILLQTNELKWTMHANNKEFQVMLLIHFMCAVAVQLDIDNNRHHNYLFVMRSRRELLLWNEWTTSRWFAPVEKSVAAFNGIKMKFSHHKRVVKRLYWFIQSS